MNQTPIVGTDGVGYPGMIQPDLKTGKCPIGTFLCEQEGTEQKGGKEYN